VGKHPSIGIEVEASGTSTRPDVQHAAFAQPCRALSVYFGLTARDRCRAGRPSFGHRLAQPTNTRAGMALELRTRAHDLIRARGSGSWSSTSSRRAAAKRFPRVVRGLRPDHARLLPAHVHAPRQRAQHPRPKAVLLPANRVLARNVAPRHPAVPARPAPLPFPLVQLPYHRMVNPST
jgi:hypothetical protein